jgi:hypothetical protein
LTQQDVTGGGIDELARAVTGFDHVTVAELHEFGTLGAQFARDLDLATTSLVVHDVAQNTVAGTTHSHSLDELVAQRLGLGDRRQTATLDALGVQLDLTLSEAETLLHEAGQLTNASALVAEHVLGARSLDDQLCASRRVADLDAGIAILRELTLQQLVQLGVEHTVVDELLERERERERENATS